MKNIFYLLLILFTITCKDEQSETNCIAKPNPSCICTKEYSPVCGCNNVSYENKCAAECEGISEFTPGPCTVNVSGSLVGSWVFMGYLNADKVDLSSQEKKHKYDVFLVLDDEKEGNDFKFSGTTSINTIGGLYLGSGGKIGFKNIIQTEKGGDAAATKHEVEYMKWLAGVRLYEFKSTNLLTLNSTVGSIDEVLVYRK